MDADELQYERGYGPCIDAGLAGQVFAIDNMVSEERWPDYCRAVSERGIRSSLSIPLPFQSTTLGALNCYAGRPHAFSPADRSLTEEVASWVALVVARADSAAQTTEELSHLRTAMSSRAVIEQAKGMLMERFGVTEDEAFTLLSRASQTRNIKLRDVAGELVRTGCCAAPPEPSPSRHTPTEPAAG